MSETSRRLIVLTGASGLLGREATLDFMRAGDAVLAIGRDGGRLGELSDQVAHLGLPVKDLHACAVDLLDANAVDVVANQAQDIAASDVVLINNARSRNTLNLSQAERSPREQFVAEYTLGVSVAYDLSMGLSETFRSRLSSIVNVGSQYGLVAQNPHLYEDFEGSSAPHYGATKAALFQLTRDLSVKLARHGTRVNAIALGGVRGRVDADFEQRYAGMVPLGRMLNPSDFVGPLRFLSSVDSSGVTGHVLAVTGGWEVL